MHGGKPDHTRPMVAFVLLVLVTAATLGASLARSNADVIAAGTGPGPDSLLRPVETFPVGPGPEGARPTAPRESTAGWVPAGFGLDVSAPPVSGQGRPPHRHPETAPPAPAAPSSAPGRGARPGAPGARLGVATSPGLTARTSGQATVGPADVHAPERGDNARPARLSATAVRVALARLPE